MSDIQLSIKYPRRILIRNVMTGVGKVLLTLLADVEIIGKERLPKKGPIILAGNHAAVLEAVMMAVYNPGMVEFIGNGDIPFDPNYAWIANTYDLIRVNRGNLDQESLKMGLDVLRQDGILGIFPEGGTWDPTQMQAQIGIAWLSYKANVPVLPIGFGGIKNGLNNALKLKHPKLTMTVGELISPVKLTDESLSLKANLKNAANKILMEINALVPEQDLQLYRRRVDEIYDLNIEISSKDRLISLPEDLVLKHCSAYARFLYNPTLMDVLVRNLRLPLQPLKNIDHVRDISPLLKAWDSLLDYLKTNPGYFTYRFGVEEGLAVKQALLELRHLGEWVETSGYYLTITPVRKYRNANTGAHVIEQGGCFPKSM